MANTSTSEIELSKTFSRCLTESVTGTHDFELTNYGLLDGIGVDKIVSSSNFSVAGYTWVINFFPDGNRDSGSYASVFLDRLVQVNDKHGVRTRFTLNMLEKDGESQITNHGVIQHVFSQTNFHQGHSRFIEKSKLKSSSEDSGGYLIIRCVLTVITESRTEVKRNTVVVPQPNLQDQLRLMWKDGQGADVSFCVGGQFFNAHRCLLAARSLVFKAEFFGPMKDKETECIKIDDIEPAIFEALLHFVYTDSMLDDEQYKDGKIAKLQHLLAAADRYGFDRLTAMCAGKLCDGIGVETVATTLVLAVQHHSKDLQEACVEFMAPPNVLRAVMATDGFRHLVASCPSVMEEILEKLSRGE